MTVLAREWAQYMERLLAGASEIQVIECKRAFYAGATSIFYALIRGVSRTDDPNEVTPADEALMSSFEADLRAFADDVAAGRG